MNLGERSCSVVRRYGSRYWFCVFCHVAAERTDRVSYRILESGLCAHRCHCCSVDDAVGGFNLMCADRDRFSVILIHSWWPPAITRLMFRTWHLSWLHDNCAYSIHSGVTWGLEMAGMDLELIFFYARVYRCGPVLMQQKHTTCTVLVTRGFLL